MVCLYDLLPIEIVFDIALLTKSYDTYTELAVCVPKLNTPEKLRVARTQLIMCHRRANVIEYSLGGYLHNEGDQPAYIEQTDRGTLRKWAKFGKLHRDGDMAAVIHDGRLAEWWQHGKRHRNRHDNGYLPPAIISTPHDTFHYDEFWEYGKRV
jgi:hypothetical protein